MEQINQSWESLFRKIVKVNSMSLLEETLEVQIDYSNSRKEQQFFEKTLHKYDTTYHVTTHHTGRRIAVALLAALIAATVTVMSVSAAREWFFKVISQMFPTHTELQYGPTEESQEDEPFVAYAPSYIPEGYELKDGPRVREQARLVQIGYKGSGSRTIRYTQSFNGGSSIDTEGSHTETVELNGRDALYIQKEDTKMLYGQIDNAMFWLYVRDPDLAKDDVLKIADSIAPLEEQN